ncbi:hypothetical protein [Streptomyces sp. Amel2xC10]|uniref:hypothetical protein n=1 Tax=Streptomyces sp. Amel2xC10 TaxID=1305826 RepID=UPI000A0900DD|nr:hypothetical protein [Streptomyces sp. Amel2xC10]SMF86683.1 hypothetical protein SAMN02745830_07202 [Streptomyces sp. Amel2xC10]
MPEKHVSVNLDFITDSDPAAVGARVAEVVVAEVAARLAGAHWSGFELDDEEPNDA